MISELGRRQMIGGNNDSSLEDELEREIGMLLSGAGAGAGDDRERELNIYRSGSAPPTVQGSLSAVGGLFGGPTSSSSSSSSSFSEFARAKNNGNNGVLSEEELRADPAYLQYYYSNVNLNPRLPPPLLSKEDWRFAQRLQGGSSGLALGGIGDNSRRMTGVNRSSENGPGRSLFSMPPGFGSKREERELDPEKAPAPAPAEWVKDGLPGIGLGSKQKSLAEIFQDDLGRSNPPSRHPSRPASRNAFEENADALSPAEAELALLLHESANVRVSSAAQNLTAPASGTYASALGASPLSRSTTPDPQHIARALSPCPTVIGEGRPGAASKKTASYPSLNGISLARSQSADLVAALSAMNMAAKNGSIDTDRHLPLPNEQHGSVHHNYLFNGHGTENSYLKRSDSGHLNMPGVSQPAGRTNLGGLELRNPQVDRPKSVVNSSVSHSNGSSAHSLNGSRLLPHHPNLEAMGSSVANYGLGGFSPNSMMANQPGNFNLPPLLENAVAASAMGIAGLDSRVIGSGLPSGQGSTSGNALQTAVAEVMYLQYLRSAEYAALAQAAALEERPDERLYLDMMLLQKSYLGVGSSTPLQKPQLSDPLATRSCGSNHNFYLNQAFGVGMGFPGNPLTTPVIPNSSGVRNLGGGGGGGGMGSWHGDGNHGSSLLEEFKSNKTKSFELSEIAGHVVEFSADQYGSRFIQQKLETATIDEKNMVFEEIYPHTLSLMTDVFGNYVIQKFFEHGMDDQRRELANKLDGHVLTLSLQMYGCRVIQKAIEVVDLDQKIKMVQELDGNIMRCVRDQNGNHVIQKCIECVPEEHIHFIVESFFDHVVTLSTHPYGCRVIQRVLEHCNDAETQNKVMDEILGSVSMLAQDQYGNYVVQHVLEHGKPHERTSIIKELAGKIVQMSQQKFASNVVEKCLAFGNAEERELLVNEMLGTTDENEPLQAMMKDQFANYVVQKVLETCSDQQREYILARIKVHLNALKKYTYGKHIVARVEKLVAAGERRVAGQTPQPA